MPENYCFGKRPDAPKSRNEKLSKLFNVSCVKCGTVNLKFIMQTDDETGEPSTWLICPRCNLREKLI